MKRKSSESDPDRPTTSGVTGIPNQTSTTESMAHEKSQKRMGKRPGRKPSKIDQRAKLERSRQSARECRARKKLRYQYLEELVSSREKAVFSLREEVEMYKRWSVDLDRGIIPESLLKLLAQEEMQKPLAMQSSPHSQVSTPSASPSSVDTDYMNSQPGAQSTLPQAEPHAAQLGQQSGQLSQGQLLPQQQTEHSRRQQLTRQPNVSQQLSSMNRGCRSFEESSRTSSSSSASASALVYRSGSVPNLTAATTAQHCAHPSPVSTSSGAALVFRDFQEDSGSSLTSTGFLPQLSMLSKVITDSDTTTTTNSNIPTVISHQSPPAATSKPGAAWTWDSPQLSVSGEASQARTYPYTCASSVMQAPQSAQLTSQAFAGEVFCSTKSVSPIPNFLQISRNTVNAGSNTVVPFYQRPRSSSDLARRVTSSAVPSPVSSSSSSSSLSQQNLPGLFSAPVTTYSSQNVYPTMTDSVTTCLANSSILQDTAPVCMGSELSASISEPLPHWYSFLDDLENVASFSARQGAFSDAGTPGSSRARSGAGTPSSVDSPYSQQLVQQQQQHEGGSDGNIPNIISDLLGQPPSS